jgi:hypothetical protein
MNNNISLEQGDINASELRQQHFEALDEQTRHWINEDASYFLHQALSTPVMNVLSKTEGPFIYDLNGKAYLDLHGNGVHNAGFSNPDVIKAVIEQLQQSLAFTPRRYTNIPAIQLAKKLVEVTPAGLDRNGCDVGQTSHRQMENHLLLGFVSRHGIPGIQRRRGRTFQYRKWPDGARCISCRVPQLLP